MRVKKFKKQLFTLIALLALSLGGNAGVLVIEGNYQLRNVYVLNPFSESGVGNCITEVTVNDEIAPDNLNSNAFEIDLGLYNLKMGDEVLIKITYRDGCEPKILNPGALKPTSTFEIASIAIDHNGILTWTTINEQGTLPFVIQQKKWNKWVNLGEIKGAGTSNENEYKFQVNAVSGKNEVRVIQKSYDGTIRRSESVNFESPKDQVTFEYDRKSQLVVFSNETQYEIYNEFGQIVKRAFSNKVDVSELDRGKHYVSFDNTHEEFVKR